MNNYEMAYLNWLEKQYEIKRIARSVQKTYGLMTFMTDKNAVMDFNNLVGPLSLEEEVFLDKASELLGVKILRDYQESSLQFQVNDVVYKIFFLHDQDVKCITRVFQKFDPNHNRNVDTRMMIVGKRVVEDRALLIEFFTSLTFDLMNDYTNTTGIDLVGSPGDYYYGSGASLRRIIDYFIIIFRILDGILDLKFEDWHIVHTELFGPVEINKLAHAYEFAIRTDATEDDYCSMVKKSLNDYEYNKDFEGTFKILIGVEEEKNDDTGDSIG